MDHLERYSPLRDCDTSNPAFRDLSGGRFGKLQVQRLLGRSPSKSTIWAAVCDCGRAVAVNAGAVASGRTRSCGCLAREKVIRHGCARRGGITPEYRSWSSAIDRCERDSHEEWHRYGGRGIAMCARWREDFAAFLADMGPRRVGTTLDRLDNDKGYEPGNCRWATWRQQGANRGPRG